MTAQYSLRECVVGDLVAWKVPVRLESSLPMLVWYTLITAIRQHGFACILSYRVNRMLLRYFPRCADMYATWRYYRFANDISHHAIIGPGCKIHHTSDIVIGKGVVIGKNCSIYNGVTLGAKKFDKPHEKPHIGDGVICGTGAKVLGAITVGNHAIIGALTLCCVSVPEHGLAIGNPAVIKEHYTQSHD